MLVRAANGKSITVRITNECPLPCAPGQLDLSQQAFVKLADLKGRPDPHHLEPGEPQHLRTDIYGERLTITGIAVRPNVVQPTQVQFARH